MAMRANHAQLLSVGFVPLFAWLVWNAASALAADAPRRLVLWGALAAVLMAAWLMTAYYMAWFTLFFLSCYALIGALTAPRMAIARVHGLSGRSWLGLAIVALVFALGPVPFLALYLPKAAMTGMHSFAEVLSFTVQPLDLVHVGDGNLLFSRLDALLNGYFRPALPRYSEHTTGLTPVLLVVFGLACAGLWTRRWIPARGGRAVWLLATTAVATWLLTLHVGDRSPWVAVYDLVPGAKGLRIVVRYQLFLAAPVIAVAVAYLAQLKMRVPAWLLALVAVVLAAEQVTLQQPVALDRRAELAQLQSIPPPPAAVPFFLRLARTCRYLLQPRGERDLQP